MYDTPVVEAGDYSDMTLEFYDFTQTAFSSVGLPELLELSDFTVAEFSCRISESRTAFTYYFRADGSLTSLRLVPEPATMMLLGVGVLFTIRKN